MHPEVNPNEEPITTVQPLAANAALGTVEIRVDAEAYPEGLTCCLFFQE